MYCSAYPSRWSKDPAPRLHIVSWLPFACLPIPLPSLISNSSNLSFGTQGRTWMLESIPDKQDTGHMDRLACPGAPQGPACFYARPPPPPPPLKDRWWSHCLVYLGSWNLRMKCLHCIWITQVNWKSNQTSGVVGFPSGGDASCNHGHSIGMKVHES